MASEVQATWHAQPDLEQLAAPTRNLWGLSDGIQHGNGLYSGPGNALTAS